MRTPTIPRTPGRTEGGTARARIARRAPTRKPDLAQRDTSWGVLGNTNALTQLQRAVRGDLEHHAFLFVGPRGMGKSLVARAFANALVCDRPNDARACGDCRNCVAFEQGRHPDLHILEVPTPGATSAPSLIDAVRALRLRLEQTPFIAVRHVALVLEADRMSEQAANALLKTLEEPRGSTVLILTTETEQALPSTLASRCAVIHFTPVSPSILTEELERRGVDRRQARGLVGLSDGRPGFAILLSQQPHVVDEVVADGQLFLNLIQAGIGERLHLVSAIATACEDHGRQTTLLERWESTVGRLLRLAGGAGDTGPLHERLRDIARQLGLERIARLASTFLEARRRIRQAGNLRLDLESLVVHLPTP